MIAPLSRLPRLGSVVVMEVEMEEVARSRRVCEER